jgi:putative ABC transport system ATP-binding protein
VPAVRSGAALLATDRLTRALAGRAIVNGVSIEVAAGEILAISGPSGSGKTSFLRLLNRLDEPTGGTVYLEGADYRSLPTRELRRRVGMMMQSAFLFPGTLADNVRFGPLQHGTRLDDGEVERLLASAGLGGRAREDVRHLSGGEAQRLSLVRALANRPSVLLLDEPTSALDEESRLAIEALVRSAVGETGAACLMVTHDTAQALRLARRAMVLEDGRLTRLGSVEKIFHAQNPVP